MNEPRKLSRREWFRLNAPHQNKSLGDVLPTTRNIPLQTTEQPPHPDGFSLAQLPPMLEAVLTLPDLDSLLADIDQLASDVTLLQRANHSGYDSSTVPNASHRFKLARTALVSGQTNRIQIRYHWQGKFWIDTLEKQDCGFRLVRIAHQQAFATGFKVGDASHD